MKLHEIRDPIHVFVRLDTDERKVVDSRPFQRLRHIHQLAMSYLIYPGATHKRFEHSIGVMELATRVFDVITNPIAIHPYIREILPEITDEQKIQYWKRVIRMAALCHDLGHLPFSHAAEHDLLPEGWDHEQLTRDIIASDEMKTIWSEMTPPLREDDIIKLALGPRKAPDLSFSRWETILAEIIVGDAFGVDRMDYLLRDSYHAGVAYGKFDHYRLIDTLRVLPSCVPDEETETAEPSLGIEEGGLQSTEALLLARYFMFSQVYYHHVRIIYDHHLKDFLTEWLPERRFSTDIGCLLEMTDNEVTAAFRKAAIDPGSAGHDQAKRIVSRGHYRMIYERNPADIDTNPDASRAIALALKQQFGDNNVKDDLKRQKGGTLDFPVLTRDGRIVSADALSQTLRAIPVAATDYVFIEPGLRDKAGRWLKQHRADIIRPREVSDGQAE